MSEHMLWRSTFPEGKIYHSAPNAMTKTMDLDRKGIGRFLREEWNQ